MKTPTSTDIDLLWNAYNIEAVDEDGKLDEYDHNLLLALGASTYLAMRTAKVERWRQTKIVPPEVIVAATVAEGFRLGMKWAARNELNRIFLLEPPKE